MSATASNNSSTPVYIGAHDVEKGRPERIERVVTPGGHPADFSQPAIPQQHVSARLSRNAAGAKTYLSASLAILYRLVLPASDAAFSLRPHSIFMVSGCNAMSWLFVGSSGKAQGVHTPNVVVP
jgi:hypothetical protein